jgi:hypothetical protein
METANIKARYLLTFHFIRTPIFFLSYKSFFPLTFTPTNSLLMDSKITLSFDQQVIKKAKEYAASQNISLSRLVEFLLRKTTSGEFSSMEDYPINDWVRQVAEGPAEYRTRKRSNKEMKDEYYRSKK